MTTERPGAPRLVVDPGVYISAIIRPTGPPAQLLESAVEGQAVLVVSPRLLTELREVLSRKKFRRWITLDDVEAFVQGVELLAEHVEDPSDALWPTAQRVSRDPKDDYLVALAETAGAHLLVSGDGDLLTVDRPGLDIRNPRDAVEAVHYRHAWGSAFIPGEAEAAWSQAEAEGHSEVLKTVGAFLVILQEDTAQDLLPFVVTPESLPAWLRNLPTVREASAGRGMGSRADYPAPDVAYVKLPPDPGDTVRATGDVLLEDAIIASLQRRPELPDRLGLGGWRVHGIGHPVPPEEMPTPAGREDP